MENGYVKIPIETYDDLKREIMDLKARNKNLEMRLNLQFTPGIQATAIHAGSIKPGKPNHWFHD